MVFVHQTSGPSWDGFAHDEWVHIWDSASSRFVVVGLAMGESVSAEEADAVARLVGTDARVKTIGYEVNLPDGNRLAGADRYLVSDEAERVSLALSACDYRVWSVGDGTGQWPEVIAVDTEENMMFVVPAEGLVSAWGTEAFQVWVRDVVLGPEWRGLVRKASYWVC